MEQNKKSEQKGLSNRTYLKLVAVLLAFICWFFVATTGTSQRSTTIRNVKIDLSNQENALAELGLNIIETSLQEVSVEIIGERVAVGNAIPEELTATVQLPSDFSGPDNTYKLNLVPLNSLAMQNKGYKIVKYVPESITIKLDRIERKTIPITTNITGNIKLAEGFIQEKEMVLNPSQVVVSGPQNELDQINSAVIDIEITEELTQNYVAEHPIKLLNPEGKELVLDDEHLTIDYSNVQVIVPLLKQINLPLYIEFLKAPRNFPTEQLAYTFSNKTISTAGPVDLVDKYNEILLGFVDISQISMSKNTFVFEVDLPDKFVNMENISTVTVDFDKTQWQEVTLDVDVSNMNITNVPEGYEIQLITDHLPNVKMVGNKDVINGLTEEDLAVEIDLAEKRELSPGQYQQQVKISAPIKGLVWASGEYSVVIKVIETDIDV